MSWTAPPTDGRPQDVDVAAYGGDVVVVLLDAGSDRALLADGGRVGALLHNQIVAGTVALVWVTLVEGLLVAFEPEVGRWLPGGAGSALTGVATAEVGLLPMWGAALLFAGYGLAFAAAGTLLSMRRDVT